MNQIRGSWGWQLLASAVIVGGVATSGNCALGQVVGDTTLGAESSRVTSPIPGGYLINGGATRGTNLFHSFQEFSIPTNGIAFFNNALTIQNIISRVTGVSVSNIDGTIRANGTANLFLINPNGIVFGPNASLNIGGSFFASTARGVVFDNGFEFSATNPQAPPLLTINVPIGLQTGANPGRIVNQSRANGVGLRVQPGRTLALVGGEVAIEGGILFAPDGRIELGSVADNNRVNLTPTDTGYTLGYEGVENFQDIRLRQRAFVTTQGNSGGSIQVQGRNLLLTDGSQVNANLLGAGVGGDLSVNASDSVQVIGHSANGRASALGSQASATATGEAGDLTITTRQLLIRDGAQVSTSTVGAGKGGNVTVNASDSVQVIGRSADDRVPSGLFTGARGNVTGQAGDLRITTSQLLIRDGAAVNASTVGTGKGGNVTVNASESVQLIGTSADGQIGSGLFTQASGTGDAGDLRITTSQLLIRDGAGISASTFSSGKGGNVTVNASDSVQVIGTSGDSLIPSRMSAQASGTGDAGDMTITTRQLLVSDGAQVSASTFGSGKGGILTVNASESVQVIGHSADVMFPSALGARADRNLTGDAGELRITTSQLLIQDGADVGTGTFGSGKGGILTVNASESVQVIGRSANGEFASNLSAQADQNSTGDAGDFTITTSQLLIRDGAQVSASTFGSGKGGNLTVYASDSVQAIGTSADGRRRSNLSVEANRNSTGDAGDLTITTGELLIRDGAEVTASTSGSGKGGNLTVYASDSVQAIGTSINGESVSALSARTEGKGDAGNLTITTSELLVRDGAEVGATTFGSGKGGNLIVNASNSVQLSGASGLFVDATAGGTAGSLTLETEQLSVQDGSQITVSSPRGQAGNMRLATNSLFLNRGSITAETAKSGAEGGANITLQDLDLLRMDNESLISANALEDANGGNVTIDSTFIVATPPKGPEGSDITANAIRGNGGRVNITTQGLFGIEFRPKLTPNNDITASSEYGIAGEVAINSPDVDPSRGLAELPTDVVDASEQIDRRCTPASRTGDRNSFTITGRGGLPPSPNDVLQGESVITNWVTLDPPSDNSSSNVTSVATTAPQTPTITEAQSWRYGSNGEVILTADASNIAPDNPMLTPVKCDKE